ncbi:hypothetical protein BDR04DRAFT_1227278 [Suillus decipiens]|nr:hypothetical protein BDR04DRAFT_1227278 [Suillus decipiens]
MPSWAIASNLKLRIPVLRHVQGLSIRQICEVLGTRKSLAEDINYIKSHCYLRSSVFLDELQSQLLLRRHVKISLSTSFELYNVSALQVKKLAEAAPDPEMLMFEDEPAKDKYMLNRQWDAQHVELIVFNPDPLSEEHDGRFFLSSPMILYMAR